MTRQGFGTFVSVLRHTSIFSFHRPVRNAPQSLLRIQASAQRTPIFPRRINANFFSSTSTRDAEEIIPPRSVGYWLLGTAGLVFGIVVVGGLTRLSESGLSITEWKPVTGIIPPRTDNAWALEFEKYKSTPEYQILNPRISLDDFKSIYYMEYTHRTLGRAIGLAFALPATYFIVKRKVSTRFAWRLGGIGALIGFQGFLGWWMVRSGLNADGLQVQDGVPRVSQYRLAAHLGTAFGVYSIMVLLGLSVLRKNKFVRLDSLAQKTWIDSLVSPEVKSFRGKVVGLSHITFLTVLSGALVAGLDAGLIYNEFPKMGEGLIPPSNELFNPYYTRSENPSTVSIIAHNIGENPVLVQLDHRLLATATFMLVTLAWISAIRRPLPQTIKNGMHNVMGFAVLQVTLGIATLIYMVPTHLAATHQAGSLALLTAILVLLGRLRAPTVTRLLK